MNTPQKEFKFPPRIKAPQIIPHFLEGSDAEAFLEEYNVRVKENYNDNKNLKVLFYDNSLVKGSNAFAPILVNQILENQGYRTATLSDIEQTLRDGDTLDIKGNYYVDLGIVLRSRGNPNSYLANNLADQIENRKIKLNNPLYIPSSSLELICDDRSKDYGLSFKSKENAEIIEAPQFIIENDRKKFSKTNEKGFPIFDENGSRRIWTRKDGLCGLSLGRNLGLYSDDDDLADSGDDGRVVVVSGEATHASLPNILAKN